ncbi:hypothetical protein CHS0354_035898 [Potamilus streckersoni]|uniref:MULE transposase domain-containing protein n=1 Tax=Potamilus streckersoni TaxID=2493646 RepID=A0AAE0T6I4_9BIVA|nr:hypothetical protein CHS0354_035898 [Potamilus streckersoni]
MIEYSGITYTILEESSQKHTMLLVFSLGFSYVVLGEPFRQLGQVMSIYAFIERNGVQKQLPLVFSVMSRKTKSDYLAVFRYLQSRLGYASLEGFVLDIEKAAWLAMREVFPGVELKGWVSHRSHAVWRHVQFIGLVETYIESGHN